MSWLSILKVLTFLKYTWYLTPGFDLNNTEELSRKDEVPLVSPALATCCVEAGPASVPGISGGWSQDTRYHGHLTVSDRIWNREHPEESQDEENHQVLVNGSSTVPHKISEFSGSFMICC